VSDGGVASTQWMVVEASATVVTMAKSGSGTGWTNSGNKGLYLGDISYEF
jgi:hypothetical protein